MHVSIDHLISGKIFLISEVSLTAHLFGQSRILVKQPHRLHQSVWIVRRDNPSGLFMDIDVTGTGSDLARNHWFTEHCPFKKRYAERLGAQMGREYDSITEIIKSDFILIRQGSKKSHFGKSDLGCVLAQFSLDRSRPNDHQRIVRAAVCLN